MTTSSRFFTGWRKGLLVALLCYSALHLASAVLRYNPWTAPEVSGDFRQVYTDALDFRLHWEQTGKFPVAPVEGLRVYHGLPANFLLFPFTYLEFTYVDHFFYLLQFLLFPAAIFLLLKAVRTDSSPNLTEIALAVLLIWNFKPFLETLALHKMEGIEFFLICLALVTFKKKRDFLTGALLLTAASLKYLPGILLVYFLFKREFKVLLGALGAGLAFLVFMLIFFGPSSMEALFRHPLDLLFRLDLASNFHAANIEWQTVSGTVNRWFAPPATGNLVEWLGVGFAYPLTRTSLPVGISIVLKVLIGGIYLYVIRNRWAGDQRKEKWPLYLLEISLTLIMLIVWIQAIRIGYASLLLPAYLTVALLFYRQWNLFRLKEKVLFGLAYALGATIIPMGLVDKLFPHPVWGPVYAKLYYWWGLPFYGFMMLGVCLLLCHKRMSRAAFHG